MSQKKDLLPNWENAQTETTVMGAIKVESPAIKIGGRANFLPSPIVSISKKFQRLSGSQAQILIGLIPPLLLSEEFGIIPQRTFSSILLAHFA